MANVYPENEVYSKMAQSAYSLGNSLPKPVAPRQYNNLANTVKSSTPSSTNLGVVTTPYGGNTNYEGFHPGVDIANKKGTPIPSFTEGVVTEVREGQTQNPNKPSFGNYVVVKDPQGNLVRYSHLHQSFVKVGEKVNKGFNLGSMGNSGSTYSNSGGDGSHLDLRIKDAFGKYIDPTSFIK